LNSRVIFSLTRTPPVSSPARPGRLRHRACDGDLPVLCVDVVDVVTFDWETLAATGVAGGFADTAAVERRTNSRDGGRRSRPSRGRPMSMSREWALARCALSCRPRTSPPVTWLAIPSRPQASEPAPDPGLVALVFGTKPALEVLLFRHNDPAVRGKHRERGDHKRPPCTDPERGAHVRGG
jgi:hypothetical protein